MTTLLDLCELIVDCEHKTAPLADSGYPSIRTPNVGRGRLILNGVNRVSEETYLAWSRRATPQQDDLIIAREAPLGNVAIIPKGLKVCLGQRTVLVRPDKQKVDPRYLCYFLLGDYAQNRFHGAASGATVPHLNMKDIRGLLIPELPPIQEQRRIASILTAYDDLIENNTRRIAILEEMARRIYEEWFVHFRFPGHERVKMVESELGLIPEGWEVVAASDAITINPKVNVPKEGLKPFIPMGSLSENSMLVTDVEEREGNSGSKFQNGDTLFARISPCLENGKTGFVQFLPTAESVAFGSTEFIVMRSRRLCPEFVYALARSDTFRANAIKSMSGATGRQRVRDACFDTFMLVLPDEETLQRFRGIVQPMFSMIWALARMNDNLRITRDLLLPKLVSGDIEIRNGFKASSAIVTLTIEGELSEKELEKVRLAFSRSLELYRVREVVHTPPPGLIGFITKEEIRQEISLLTEVVRKNAAVTVMILNPIVGNVALNVVGNLATDMYKQAFSGKSQAEATKGSRVVSGKITDASTQQNICGNLNLNQINELTDALQSKVAEIHCEASGYTIRIGQAK